MKFRNEKTPRPLFLIEDNFKFNQGVEIPFLNKVPQGKRTKASNATPMKAFERYFRNIGMEKKGVTLDNLICNVLKNTSDEFDFQEAHQDYFPKVISIKVPNYTKLHLAWSAIIPMTSDGSFILTGLVSTAFSFKSFFIKFEVSGFSSLLNVIKIALSS